MIGTHVGLQLKAIAIFVGASSGYVFFHLLYIQLCFICKG
jgi:hypothetical protein